MSTNKRLLNTLIWPIATYGSKSWTYTKSVINKIQAFEMTTDPQLLTVSQTQRKLKKSRNASELTHNLTIW